MPHPRQSRNPRSSLNSGGRAVLLAVALVLAAIGAMSMGGSSASASAPPDSGPPGTSGFMTGTVDIGSCVSALPRPECDTEHKGDWHFYVVVGVLTAGLTFIGWRIVRGVKARERALSAGHRSP